MTNWTTINGAGSRQPVGRRSPDNAWPIVRSSLKERNEASVLKEDRHDRTKG